MSTLIERLTTLITDIATDYKAAMLQKNNSTIYLTDPTNDQVFEIEIDDDSSSTASWSNRLAFYFKTGGVARLTSWFNEYGEFRVQPGKSNTVAFRVFGQEDDATTHTGYLVEVCDNRVARTTMFSVDQDGNVTIAGDVTLVTVNGKTYYPIYPPGVTPSGSDPDGLVIST
jgi:hypothetical protein